MFFREPIIAVMAIIEFISQVIDFGGEVGTFFYSFKCKHREVI